MHYNQDLHEFSTKREILIFNPLNPPYQGDLQSDCVSPIILYTLRSSGAQGFPLLLLYRYIAPLERKTEHLPNGLGDPTLCSHIRHDFGLL